MQIKVIENILAVNKRSADENQQMMDRHRILALNVMGSPGAGKTSLVERTVSGLAGRLSAAVIEGDIATTYDSQRIAKLDVQVVQIATGGECHLDAAMVGEALQTLDLTGVDVVIIENVGNLVCPAEFDLGEHKKIVVASIPEGDDKIEKYPLIFQVADAVVVNKLDLVEMVDFDVDLFESRLSELNPRAAFFKVSCRTGEGVDSWIEWVASARDVRG